MASIIGDLVYRITGETSGIDKSVKKTDGEISKLTKNADKSGLSVGKLGGALKALGAVGVVAAIAGVGKALFDLAKPFVQLASDAEETGNKFRVTFDGIINKATKVSDRLSKEYSLASSSTQKLLASTGDLLTGFGFTQDEALTTAESVLKLSADLASFQNIAGGTNEVVQRLNSALTGETEGLKSLGIVVRQDSDEFRNLVKDIKESTGVSDTLAKSQAILQTALKQSKNAANDFIETQDSYANITRKNEEQTKRISEALGRFLLPVFEVGAKIVNSFLTSLADALNPTRTQRLVRLAEEIKKAEEERLEIEKSLSREQRNIIANEKNLENLESQRNDLGEQTYLTRKLEYEQRIKNSKLAIENTKAENTEYDKLTKKIEALREEFNKLDAEDPLKAERAREKSEAQIKAEQERAEIVKSINKQLEIEELKLQELRNAGAISLQEESEKYKESYINAYEKAIELLGTADPLTQKLKEVVTSLGVVVSETKNEVQEIDKLTQALSQAEGFSGFLTGDGAQEVQALVGAVKNLSDSFADLNKNGEDSKVKASDLVSLFISLAQAIGEVAAESDNKALKTFGKILQATFDVRVGLETLFPLLTFFKNLASDTEDAWISLIPIVGPIIQKFRRDNAEAFKEIEEGLNTLSDETASYVENLKAELLNKAVDYWAEYQKEVIRINSGIQQYLDENAAIDKAREERKNNEIKAGLQDVLDSNATEYEKSLAREELTYIQNQENIARINKENADAEAELEKKISLVKLAIKKSEFESSISVRLAELRADEAAALAGVSDIRRPSKRREAASMIMSAYSDAYSAIGAAATAGGQGFELERQAITGGLTPEDFEDTESFANKKVEEMSQPIVITLDGKTVSETMLNYLQTGIVPPKGILK